MERMEVAGRFLGIIFLLLIVIFIWGFVGGQAAKKVGVTCDTGFTESFCWFWHKNPVGEFQDDLENTSNEISNLSENMFE